MDLVPDFRHADNVLTTRAAYDAGIAKLPRADTVGSVDTRSLYSPGGAMPPSCFAAGTLVHMDGDLLALAGEEHEEVHWVLLVGAALGAALGAELAIRRRPGGSAARGQRSTRHDTGTQRLASPGGASLADETQGRSESAVAACRSPSTTRVARRADAQPRVAAWRRGLALVVCLGLALLTASAQWRADRVPLNSAALPSPSSLQAIEGITVGQRVVVTENPAEPFDDSLGREVDPATWRQITLRPDAQSRIVLLRPQWWIEERLDAASEELTLCVPEVGMLGEAEVVSLLPCPKIAPGSGPIVIGTFQHEAPGTILVTLAGLAEPIRCTPNHATWSHDRQQFVAAQTLRSGERVATLHGLRRVLHVTPHPFPTTVYNLEVLGPHVYHVSPLGVLVHNASPGGSGYDPGKRVDEGNYPSMGLDPAEVIEKARAGGPITPASPHYRPPLSEESTDNAFRLGRYKLPYNIDNGGMHGTGDFDP